MRPRLRSRRAARGAGPRAGAVQLVRLRWPERLPGHRARDERTPPARRPRPRAAPCGLVARARLDLLLRRRAPSGRGTAPRSATASWPASGGSAGARSTPGRRTAGIGAARSARRAARRSPARSRMADARRRSGRRLPALRRRAPAGGRRGADGVRGDLPRPGRRARAAASRVVCGACAGGAAYSPALGDLDDHGRARGAHVPHRPARSSSASRASGSTADELGGPHVHAPQRRRPSGRAPTTSRAADLVRDAARAPARRAGAAAAASRRRAEPPAGDPAEPCPPSHRRVYDVRDVDPPRLVDARRAARAGAALGAQHGRRPRAHRGHARRRDRQPAAPPRRHHRRRGRREGRVVRRALRPLRPAAGRARGHARASSRACARSARASSATAPTLLRAFGRATVPRVTVILRQAYGGAYIVMNCRDLGAD